MMRLELFAICVWQLALTNTINTTYSAFMDCPSYCHCVDRPERVVTECNRQNLTYVPLHLPTNTQELYLKENNIRILREGSFDRFSALQTLVMNHCNIQRIDPNVFSGLRLLGKLDLRWNHIKELQSYTFSGLHQLYRLILDNNDLHVIQDFAFHGLNLTQLSLKMNPNMAEIGQKAFYSAKIYKLVISNATLSAKSAISLLPLSTSLRDLNLENNRVNLDFPHNLFQGFNFRNLNLNNNGISNPAFLKHVTSAKIALVGNPIGPVQFSCYPNMHSVRQLRLANTHFWHIQGSFFKDLTQLTHLYLDNNGITTLPGDLRVTFMRLRYLNIENNPLHCNCELLWFKQWLSLTTATVLGGHCATPKSVPLINVPEEGFLCRAPLIINISRPMNVSEADELKLNCIGSGDPSPQLTWHRPTGGRDVMGPHANRTVSRNTCIMHIKQVRPKDAGTYRCVASNLAGNASETTTVNVYQAVSSSCKLRAPWWWLVPVLLLLVFGAGPGAQEGISH